MTKRSMYRHLTFIMLLFMVIISHDNVLASVPKDTPFRVNYVRPQEEQIKVRDVNLSSNLEFKSGRTQIDPSHGSNYVELRRIDSLMRAILNDSYVSLDAINIKGYSSPEGSYQSNELLSKERARSVMSYLVTNYPSFPQSKYSVSFGGENWDGLYEMILNSDMPDKMRVMKIIYDVDVMAGREVQLMHLSGGAPYKYILANFFPALRKVDLSFVYNVRNFDLSEAAEIYKTNPKALSLAEIYDVASEYSQDSPEFRSMMVTSAKLFPDSDIANLNAAVAFTKIGDDVTAAKYLSKANPSPADLYYNILGVNQAFLGELGDAEASLEKGILENSADAEYNLLLLRRPKTIIDVARDTVYIRDTVYREFTREIPVESVRSDENSPKWALKTNLLYWLALQPNIETEFYFANRWSLNLEYQVAWWSRPAKHQYYQYMHFGLEARYWFKGDGNFAGHHMGLYAGGGYYDLSLGRKDNTYEGYQGEFAVAAGLTYGYAWNLKKSLWMEAGIGVGYVMTEYRKYKYYEGCYVYQSTERLQFFGPTKLRLSLIWRPNFRPKNK